MVPDASGSCQGDEVEKKVDFLCFKGFSMHDFVGIRA
jgi:hypothetical protein